MFPAVAGLADYAPVAQRLAEEHVVIHEHLVRIDAVLLRLDGDPDTFADLDRAVAALAEDLLSHFTYEETELAEPLGLLGTLQDPLAAGRPSPCTGTAGRSRTWSR